MIEEVITKRVHISGLTPAITAKDLPECLASLGPVKAIDGFGALDALEQPRKFAYATLETTKGKLARCAYTAHSRPQLPLIDCSDRYEPQWCDVEGHEVAPRGGEA